MEICVYDGGFFIKWINSSAINDRECNYWKTFNFSYFRGTYPEARCHIWLGKGEISEWKGFIGEKSLRQSLDGREARACGGECSYHTREFCCYIGSTIYSVPTFSVGLGNNRIILTYALFKNVELTATICHILQYFM